MFADVTPHMQIAQDEMFGPVVSIIKVTGEEEAVPAANDTEYGLSSAVFSGNVERGVRVARQVQAGMTQVNDSPVNDLPNCPFGGEKNSGLGVSAAIGLLKNSPRTIGSTCSTSRGSFHSDGR